MGILVHCIDAHTNEETHTVSLCVSSNWGEIMSIFREFEYDCFEHGRQQYKHITESNDGSNFSEKNKQNFYSGPEKSIDELYVEIETGNEWAGIINMPLTRVRLFIRLIYKCVVCVCEVRWGESEGNLLPFGNPLFRSHGVHTMYTESKRY